MNAGAAPRGCPSRYGSGLSLLAGAVLLFGLAGCATMTSMEPQWPKDAWELPYPPGGEPQRGQILHVRTGRMLSEEELLGIAADARVVYVSEAHDNLDAHRVQARVLEALDDRHPGTVAVGMEMFPFTAQDELDRFNRGEMSEREFRRFWARHWNVDQDYYEPVLEVVRARNIPIIALNLPQEQIRTIGREGLDGLAEGHQETLPEMGPEDPYQRAFLASIFAGHAMGSGQIERFVTVQNLWEESMAEQAARYLGGDGERRLLIIAGGHHIDYGFGIPRRLFRRVPVSYLTIMPRVADTAAIPEEKLMDVETPALPLLPADVYWFVGYTGIPEKQKLGVAITPADGGLKVMHVAPGSPAEAAGILAEDLLLELDGVPLVESFDLIDLIRGKTAGDSARILLDRGGEMKLLEATFSQPEEPEENQ